MLTSAYLLYSIVSVDERVGMLVVGLLKNIYPC